MPRRAAQCDELPANKNHFDSYSSRDEAILGTVKGVWIKKKKKDTLIYIVIIQCLLINLIYNIMDKNT